MSRYGYMGHRVPALVPTPLHEGWVDAAFFFHMEQLYRRPRWKRALYATGWRLGRVMGRAPVRRGGEEQGK